MAVPQMAGITKEKRVENVPYPNMERSLLAVSI